MEIHVSVSLITWYWIIFLKAKRMSGKLEKETLGTSHSCSVSENIFDKQVASYNKSKTVKILNFIYSFIVGILSACVSSKYAKYHRTLGILMALMSYITGQSFLQDWCIFIFIFFIRFFLYSISQTLRHILFLFFDSTLSLDRMSTNKISYF